MLGKYEFVEVVCSPKARSGDVTCTFSLNVQIMIMPIVPEQMNVICMMHKYAVRRREVEVSNVQYKWTTAFKFTL